jgi:hypothetical protein
MDQPTENQPAEQTNAELSDNWGTPVQLLVCGSCGWGFFTDPEIAGQRCPHCFKAELSTAREAARYLPYTHPPELVSRFKLASGTLETAIKSFASGIPFAPKDLNAAALRQRLRRLYLPVWLVDAQVRADWKAEAGFNYQVVSHQSRYEQNRNAWSTREVMETRTRWEPRLGKLERSYQNITSPALESFALIEQQLGKFDLTSAQSYQPADTYEAFVRLPDRSPQDAWVEAQPAFQTAAAEECRQACQADSIRQFSWQPEYASQNWTLLLLPLYASYYLDDAQTPQPVYVNGQNGAISGFRRASQKRARETSLYLLIAALVVFLIGAGLSLASLALPPALVIGIAAIVIAFLLAAGAAIPVATVWWFNRDQSS